MSLAKFVITMAFSRLFLLLILIIFSSIDGTATSSTIVVGAGMSGIMAAKTLSENGVKDFIILEGTSRIGGRMHKESIAGYTVEKGTNWVEGVGGPKMNPIWSLAQNTSFAPFIPTGAISLTIFIARREVFCLSLLWRALINWPTYLPTLVQIYPKSCTRAEGKIFPFWLHRGHSDKPPRVTSLKNVEPNPTFEDFGEDEYFVADSRGYEYIIHGIGQEFLHSSNGSISDPRLKLNKVVRKIEYTDKGVKVSTEDGSVYSAKNAIVSVSVGVLQTKLIDFKPDLPLWKLMAIYKWDMVIYCKIFMKFPSKFWPTGAGTEFFMYAHEKRGYYNFWQHLENEYPGGNLLMVTVTDDEARRIEQQPDNETKAEIMSVLRKMFGNHIPEMEALLIPRWGQDRFYKGTYSNWPIGVSTNDFAHLKAPAGHVYFTGEHTSQDYNGYVHGAYLAGMDTANQLLDCIKKGHCAPKSGQNGHCNTDIYREMEMERQAWTGKVQVLEDALSQKCKP